MAGHEMNESWTELYHQSQERAAKLRDIEAALAALKERHIREHNALAEIVRAAMHNPEPMHYEVRAAISRGRKVLNGES